MNAILNFWMNLGVGWRLYLISWVIMILPIVYYGHFSAVFIVTAIYFAIAAFFVALAISES